MSQEAKPEKPIEQKIIEDLKKSGFASEIYADSIFTAADWDTTSGNYYFDLDENKVREYDISAFKSYHRTQNDLILAFRLHLIGEVKKSESPWVVIEKFDDTTDGWQNLIEVKNLPGDIQGYIKIMTEHSILQDCEGSGIHESFKNANVSSRWYSAIINSIKSSEDIHKSGGVLQDSIRFALGKIPDESSEYNPDEYYRSQRISSFELVKPIVVLDGRLFSSSLNESGELDVSEIPWAGFNINFGSPKYTRGYYRVDIVTLAALEDYLNMIEKMGKKISSRMAQSAKRIQAKQQKATTPRKKKSV